MPTQKFSVDGLHCDGCADTVTRALAALPGVDSVGVELDISGASTVTVSSSEQLTSAEVQSALDTKGNFQVVA